MVLLVPLDLSAAFDTIDHRVPLKRLQDEVGISDLAFRWFQSYLADRYQFVRVNKASCTYLTCGVPQGSVLGPVLTCDFQSNKCIIKRLLFLFAYFFSQEHSWQWRQ